MRIAFGGRQPVLGKQDLVVEVDRIVDPVRCRIDVDYLEIFADRSGAKRFTRWPAHRSHGTDSVGLIYRNRIDTFADRRIKSEDPQPALGRRQWSRLSLDDGGGGWAAGPIVLAADRPSAASSTAFSDFEGSPSSNAASR